MALLRRSLLLRIVSATLLAAAPGVAASSAVSQGPTDAGQALVGTYDGGQSEIAAGLELRADHRFRYGLSYGALDEEAEGRWTVADGAVLLTSDPVTPPRFVPVEEHGTPDGRLVVKLDLPEGMSGQYFRAEVRLADGTTVDRQLSEEGEVPAIAPGTPAVGLTLLLPIAGVDSGTIALSGTGGHRLRFRFEPHDLGKVAFVATALRIERGDLVLRRHDRLIRFRPLAQPPPSG